MKRNSHYTVETIGSQKVLVPSGQAVIDGGMVYHLNDTAAWTLSALEKDLDAETLLTLAEDRFEPENEAERQTLRADILEFVKRLGELGLLEE